MKNKIYKSRTSSLNSSIGCYGSISTCGTISTYGSINTYGSTSTYGSVSYDVTQRYNILGEEFELDISYETVQIICMINVLGKPYYNQLKINNIIIPEELDTILIRLFRNKLIDDIIKE